MLTSIRFFVKNMQVVMLGLLIGILTAGCWTDRWTEFNPVKRGQPITMFDRYVLEFRGHAYLTAGPKLEINVSFIGEAVDTSCVDTIPVFVIDSLCFHGTCLDSSYCGHPLDWREVNEWLRELHGPQFRGWYHTPIRQWDLWYEDGKLTPSGYYLRTSATPVFPANCIDTTVSVEIRARLLDRATGEEIARESKTLRFKFTPRKQRVIMSDISSQTLPVDVLCGRDL
ncbi:MAG: hypothetical protein ABIK83_01655 [Candidatus Zixiibacteriota bacterium]